MSEALPARRPGRSVVAVVAGVLFIFVCSTAVDLVLHAAGAFPPLDQRMSDGQFLLAFLYRLPIQVAGCYLAARLAPSRPMAHAIALSLVGFVVATAGSIARWDAGPAWFHLAVIASALPSGWAGGALRVRQLRGLEPR